MSTRSVKSRLEIMRSYPGERFPENPLHIDKDRSFFCFCSRSYMVCHSSINGIEYEPFRQSNELSYIVYILQNNACLEVKR